VRPLETPDPQSATLTTASAAPECATVPDESRPSYPRAYTGWRLRTTFSIALCSSGRFAAHSPIPLRNVAAHVAVPRLRLELGILTYVQYDFIQENGRRCHALLPVFQASQSQQAANQFVEAAGLEFDALQQCLRFSGPERCRASPSATFKRASGEAQLVRDVVEQPRLSFDQRLQPPRQWLSNRASVRQSRRRLCCVVAGARRQVARSQALSGGS